MQDKYAYKDVKPKTVYYIPFVDDEGIKRNLSCMECQEFVYANKGILKSKSKSTILTHYKQKQMEASSGDGNSTAYSGEWSEEV